MSNPTAELLQNLVQIPSANRRWSSGGCGLAKGDCERPPEAEITDFLVAFCQSRGWGWLRQATQDGAENLLVCCPGGRGGVVLWQAHQDTVDVEGMRIDPFAGTLAEGRVWGRGACDVKGGMAAILTAADRLVRQGPDDRPRLLLAFTVNEESGFTGSKALRQFWGDGEEAAGTTSGGLTVEELKRLRPEAAVVAEPTGLDVIVAHRGVVRWRCEVVGKAAHSSEPSGGANAVYAAARVVAAVEAYQREVLSRREPHPLCGGPLVCVTTIAGGSAVNMVPDHTVMDIDHRLAPGEDPLRAQQELADYVSRRLGPCDCRIEHQRPWMSGRGLSDELNGEWAQRVASAARAEGAAGRLHGAPYGTDAAEIAALGIPVVVFGPGSIEQAHTDDEWIAVDQLELAADVLYRLGAGG